MRSWGILVVIAAALSSWPQAWAQSARPIWLDVAYTYTDFAYKESAVNQTGRLGGVQGELGVSVFGTLGVSAGGQYMDGHLDFQGTTLTGSALQQTTKDYMRDLRVMAHLFYGPFTVSGGSAVSVWSDDLVVSYRRRTQVNYIPITVTLRQGPFYVKVEQDLWRQGQNKFYMSTISSSEHDVELKPSSGTGLGGEIGILLPSLIGLSTRVYLAYHKWTFKASDTQFDGVYNLSLPESSVTQIQGGIGLSF